VEVLFFCFPKWKKLVFSDFNSKLKNAFYNEKEDGCFLKGRKENDSRMVDDEV